MNVAGLRPYIWVALVGFLGLVAAYVLVIVTGHDTNTLTGAIQYLGPLLVAGISYLVKNQTDLKEQSQVITKQTNGNVSALVSTIQDLHHLLAASVPTSSVVTTASDTVAVPVVVPASVVVTEGTQLPPVVPTLTEHQGR